MGLLDSNAEELLPLDSQTGARVTTDHTVRVLHDGNAFIATYSKSLSAGSALAMTLITPASRNIDFNAECDSSLSGTFSLYEAPETSGGSTLTAYNAKRSSSTASPVTLAGSMTVTSTGTLLEQHQIGSNATSRTGGGSGTNYIELAPSTKYLLYFIADATSTRTSFNVLIHSD